MAVPRLRRVQSSLLNASFLESTSPLSQCFSCLEGIFREKNVGTPKRGADAHQFTSHMNKNQEHSSHERKHIQRLSAQNLSALWASHRGPVQCGRRALQRR